MPCGYDGRGPVLHDGFVPCSWATEYACVKEINLVVIARVSRYSTTIPTPVYLITGSRTSSCAVTFKHILHTHAHLQEEETRQSPWLWLCGVLSLACKE